MQVQVLKPSDAPPGIRRLLPLLQASLTAPDYESAQVIVAFARLSGIGRLLPQVRSWRAQGKRIDAIVGIDRLGTSKEALALMLDELDSVYITRTADESCTFHPKMYLFEGRHRARAVVGSHNLTLGGLETNFEGGVVMDLRLPGEERAWTPFRDAWLELLPPTNPCTRRLDAALLDELIKAGHLLPEKRIAQLGRTDGQQEPGPATSAPDAFPEIAPAPPSPLPKDLIWGKQRQPVTQSKRGKALPPKRPRVLAALPRALVIEVLPHHNAEILLSKKAADAFPEFLGLPFSGRAAPKKPGTPGYPTRVPAPAVEWRLHGIEGDQVHRSRSHLIYYEPKSEIRITVTPGSLAKAIPPYSIMVMWGGSSPLPAGLDYVIDLFVPGSPGQKQWESALNLTLPSGGKARGRRAGWI